jgi:hypothetical protein
LVGGGKRCRFSSGCDVEEGRAAPDDADGVDAATCVVSSGVVEEDAFAVELLCLVGLGWLEAMIHGNNNTNDDGL